MVDVDPEKIISFTEGIPGLEQYKKYALLQFEESYPIVWLQSMEDIGICLPVLDTFSVLPDYVFDIEDKDVEELSLSNPEELHVVNVVVITEEIKKMTVNLVAPIIINTMTGQARQIFIDESEYNVREPVFKQICKLIAREEGNNDANSV